MNNKVRGRGFRESKQNFIKNCVPCAKARAMKLAKIKEEKAANKSKKLVVIKEEKCEYCDEVKE